MRTDVVVVGYDGSTHAHRALDAAADLTTGRVHVVTATRPLSAVEYETLRRSPAADEADLVDPGGDGRRLLDEADALLDGRGVAHRDHLVPDDPATAILEVAEREGADLIVVGSRGVGAITRFVRGSVSTRIATHAPMSVLIVHADD